MAEDIAPELSLFAASIVSAYASNNKLSSQELTQLIGSTYEALRTVGEPTPSEPETPKADKASIKKSLQADHLTSFIDGRKYKSLKRHLNTHGMTPSEYRERYGLPNDYPMVAPSYSAQRSELAKSLGLGRKPASAEAPAEAPKPKGWGRPKTIEPKDETFS
jgi:predicted transcriptional regulator